MEGLDGIFLDPECFVGPPTIKILEGDIILQDPTVPLYLAKTVAVSTEHRQIFALRMACSAIIVKISGISTVSAFRDSARGKGKIRINFKIQVKGVKVPFDNEIPGLSAYESVQSRRFLFKILGQILMQILLP